MNKYYVYPEIEEEIDQDEEWWLEEDEQDTIEDQRATWRSEWNVYCSREDN